MADVTADINQSRAMKIAQRRVEGFAQQFGEAHRNLARHAAFPLVLTPDLLYQIWANFVPEAPWTAVAHVLLSRLCRQVGYEMYEIDIADRNLLLRELKEQFGQARLDELGEFLLDYVAQRLTNDDPDTQDLREAQEWTALAYTQPSKAARELAEAIASSVKHKDMAEIFRLSSLVETLAEPLVESGFGLLLTYVSGMETLVRGNPESAAVQFKKLPVKGRKVEIAKVSLDIPVQLLIPPFNRGANTPATLATVSSHIPFVLPQTDVSTFSGREEELRRLEELLLNRQGTKVFSIASLVGVGGIGKSALACHFATIHKDDFPDGVIGLRVDGKDVHTIAREFAHRCGEEIDSEDERDAATIMREVFAHRRMLLIFDNAEDASIRALLLGGERCAVIITTRDRFLPISLDISSQGIINLSPLSDLDSQPLLEKLIGKERVAAEPEAASDLIQLAGNLPLALQIIGATLKLNEKRSLADYAASLTRERQLARLRISKNEHFDLLACFSLSLKQLQPEEIDFFACLSVCAEDGFSRQIATAVSGFDNEYAAQEYLDNLYRLSLLNYSKVRENQYVFHPLIRLFAHNLAVERGLQNDAAARHAQFFIEFVRARNHPPTASAVAEELDNIILATKWLQQQGHFDEAVAVLKHTIAIQEQLGNQEGLKIVMRSLGRVFQQQGNLDEALAIFQRVIEISQTLNDQRSLAIGLNSLADILQQQHKLKEAQQVFEQQIAIAEALNDQSSVAIGLSCLGGLLQQQGKLDEAAATFQRQVEISEALNNQHLLANALNHLGGLLQQQGKWNEAELMLRQSYDLSVKLEDQRGQAIILNSLGQVLGRQEGTQKFELSLMYFRESIKRGQELDDKPYLAQVYTAMGQALLRHGETEKAVKELTNGFEINENSRNPSGLGKVTSHLIYALVKLGRREEALAYCQRALNVVPDSKKLQQLQKKLSLPGFLTREKKTLGLARFRIN